MRLTTIDKLIIDEFKIFGDHKHPGCGSKEHNNKLYAQLKQLIQQRENVQMSGKKFEFEID